MRPSCALLIPVEQTSRSANEECTHRDDEQADHDQGKCEGGEERALSCSAEDPGETGGEGEIWAELRTLTFLI